ncbi:MAG: Fic family protein [Aggregatilineales bacterium]
MSEWQPITDLPEDWQALAQPDLASLAGLWQEQKAELKRTRAYQKFMERLCRRFAIETGIIERLYNIDRGVTHLLIERGIDESLIQHGSTDRPVYEVIALVRDQAEAIQSVFDYVGQRQPLNSFYIRQLHEILTRHQETTEAQDQFGRRFQTQLLRGKWKELPNNPRRPDGSLHEYCPPLQVEPQIEQLLVWHREHWARNVSPEVEAAWLHHRFTQIHPFQDGNGRVARLLATLVFVKAGWFPLVLTRDERGVYIDALEQADRGDLSALVSLFADTQRRALTNALSLSEEISREHRSLQEALQAFAEAIQRGQVTQVALPTQQAEQLQHQLKVRLEQFKGHLGTILHSYEPEQVITAANSGEPNDHYYRYQIIETARRLDYFANLQNYRAWVHLRLAIPSQFTVGLLFSIHAVGRQSHGLMACTGCVYERSEEGVFADLQALTEAPFQFTGYDRLPSLEKRFEEWLSTALIVALEYLRNRL